MGYTHLSWKCPFYSYDERNCVHCEQGNRVKFKDIRTIREYERAYCASFKYEDCTIARALLADYERREKEREEIGKAAAGETAEAAAAGTGRPAPGKGEK